MSKLYSSKQIITVLHRNGFVQVGQRGSHKKFMKEGYTVIVPDPKKEIPMGTFFSILRQSGLKREEFNK
jgi:predicted RNA binding protein YcfA (HicA-like mRNA interferase family)